MLEEQGTQEHLLGEGPGQGGWGGLQGDSAREGRERRGSLRNAPVLWRKRREELLSVNAGAVKRDHKSVSEGGWVWTPTSPWGVGNHTLMVTGDYRLPEKLGMVEGRVGWESYFQELAWSQGSGPSKSRGLRAPGPIPAPDLELNHFQTQHFSYLSPGHPSSLCYPRLPVLQKLCKSYFLDSPD